MPDRLRVGMVVAFRSERWPDLRRNPQLRQLHQEGRRAPKPHGRGFRSILDEDDGAVLRSLVRDKNDGTLKEYAQAFLDKTGEEIGGSSICRALKRHGLVIKKDRAGERTATWPRWIRRAWCSLMRPGS